MPLYHAEMHTAIWGVDTRVVYWRVRISNSGSQSQDPYRRLRKYLELIDVEDSLAPYVREGPEWADKELEI